MSDITIDIKGLDKLEENLTTLAGHPDDFYDYCTKELAANLLRRTMDKTPRDTGNLINRWTDHETSDSETAKQVSIYDFLGNTDVKKKGKRYEITISNSAVYSPYVEYGHRVYRTDGTQGWVPGAFMLTQSVSEIEDMKPALLQRCLMDFLQGVFS